MNRHMRKFAYMIKNIDYVDNSNENIDGLYHNVSSETVDDVLYNYTEKINTAMKSHIKNFIKNYPVNYIRNILFTDDENISNKAEEFYTRDYPNSCKTALIEYGCYEKALYTEIVFKSYILVFDIYLI